MYVYAWLCLCATIVNLSSVLVFFSVLCVCFSCVLKIKAQMGADKLVTIHHMGHRKPCFKQEINICACVRAVTVNNNIVLVIAKIYDFEWWTKTYGYSVSHVIVEK